MSIPPKRRWPRFTLRTLFVLVTVFGVWLGYEIDWIRKRHEVLADPKVHFNFEIGDDDPFPPGQPFP